MLVSCKYLSSWAFSVRILISMNRFLIVIARVHINIFEIRNIIAYPWAIILIKDTGYISSLSFCRHLFDYPKKSRLCSWGFIIKFRGINNNILIIVCSRVELSKYVNPLLPWICEIICSHSSLPSKNRFRSNKVQ